MKGEHFKTCDPYKLDVWNYNIMLSNLLAIIHNAKNDEKLYTVLIEARDHIITEMYKKIDKK